MNVIIAMEKDELSQGERFFGLLKSPEGTLTSSPDQISWASDFLLHTLPANHRDQIFHAGCCQHSPCDSPVRIASTPGMVEERMSRFWGSTSANDMDSYYPWAIS